VTPNSAPFFVVGPFGLVPPGTIRGVSFVELGGFGGKYDSAFDRPLANVPVALLDVNGNPVNGPDGKPAATVTDADGRYQFPTVPAGDYEVRQTAPTGFVRLNTTVTPASFAAPSSYSSDAVANGNGSPFTYGPFSVAQGALDPFGPVAASGVVVSPGILFDVSASQATESRIEVLPAPEQTRGGAGFPPGSISVPVSNTLSGDFNGDGIEDLAVVLGQTLYLSITQPGQNSSHSQVRLLPDSQIAQQVVAADFNADGFTDLAVFAADNIVWGESYPPVQLFVFLNTFAPVPDQVFGGYMPSFSGQLQGPIAGIRIPDRVYDVAVGDLYGDGEADLVVWAPGSNQSLTVLGDFANGQFNRGAGYAINLPKPFPPDDPRSESRLTVGDVNGDGLVDVVTLNQASVFVFLNQGAATFVPGPGGDPRQLTPTLALPLNALQNPGTVSRALRLADINGDNAIDILAQLNDQVVAFVNTGAGTFSDPVTVIPSGIVSFVPTDVNGDGLVDLLTLIPDPTNPNQLRFRPYLQAPSAGEPVPVTVQAGVTTVLSFANGAIVGAAPLGIIAGTVSLSPPGGGGGLTSVQGLQLYLDLDGDGQFDPIEPRTVVAPGGSYAFANVPAGNYTVRVIEARLPAAFRGNTPAAAVTVVAGQTTVTNLIVTVPAGAVSPPVVPPPVGPPTTFGFTGTVELSPRTGGNGLTSVLGIVVYIDFNDNRSFDPGEPTAVAAADGSFSFTGIPNGIYPLRVLETLLPPGFAGTIAANTVGPNTTEVDLVIPIPPPSTVTLPGDGTLPGIIHSIAATPTFRSPGTAIAYTATDGVSRVRVYHGITGQIEAEFEPYPGFIGPISVAFGDIDGDGQTDIVTAPGAGGGPRVRAFDGRTFEAILDVMVFEDSFRGGVSLAVGDITGDGRDDIIVGAGAGGGPRVVVFDLVARSVVASYFAFEPEFRGGVNVAAADTDGDGDGDIVVGAGAGGGPRVSVFRGLTSDRMVDFFAYEENFLGGVYVIAGDADADGTAEVITTPGDGGGPRIRVFSGRGDVVSDFLVSIGGRQKGLLAAAADYVGGPGDELVVGYNSDGQFGLTVLHLPSGIPIDD
jgi:hypothetical protein